jgi:hypothetical protein
MSRLAATIVQYRVNQSCGHLRNYNAIECGGDFGSGIICVGGSLDSEPPLAHADWQIHHCAGDAGFVGLNHYVTGGGAVQAATPAEGASWAGAAIGDRHGFSFGGAGVEFSVCVYAEVSGVKEEICGGVVQQ